MPFPSHYGGTEMDFDHELRYFIDQDAIDEHYGKKKREVSQWLIEYTGNLKRVKEEQRKRLLAYAEAITFLQVGELDAYVQGLSTISKRDKTKLDTYLRQIDWLPKGQNMGVLEGQMVSRVPPRDPLLEKLLLASLQDEEGDTDGETRDNAKTAEGIL